MAVQPPAPDSRRSIRGRRQYPGARLVAQLAWFAWHPGRASGFVEFTIVWRYQWHCRFRQVSATNPHLPNLLQGRFLPSDYRRSNESCCGYLLLVFFCFVGRDADASVQEKFPEMFDMFPGAFATLVGMVQEISNPIQRHLEARTV